ncbi:LON peptidase substrate-binding domain-containing protein [Lunatibacter salilacus]|uniref:LON peptidase substrate-binding domain-containing protein n=1 Tax=Lunatibacter salilacus TaxID=2483804 RepID=UPI00131ECF9F|nr:LON peptidase substrate-binding domain-containing protein [Lunatibacter salilacus]
MEKTLPFFPLKLVAFPGENVNLHIFEPRYRQLIGDCLLHGITFGICVYLDKLMMYGTEVSVLEVSNVYEDGRMDIKTQGLRAFKILDFRNPLADRLYAGGEVDFLENDPSFDQQIFLEYKDLLKQMLVLLGVNDDLELVDLNSFTYSHKIGLKLTDEFQLLCMSSEEDRLRFLITHLKIVLPIMRQLETARAKIKMNGHFKSMDPLDF